MPNEVDNWTPESIGAEAVGIGRSTASTSVMAWQLVARPCAQESTVTGYVSLEKQPSATATNLT
jgi:hypothetical protein